jgi:MtN3 and saliva related transmembrane protein
MDLTTVIGIIASVLTAISMLPQLIRILREKKAETMSYWVPVILILGVGGWTWYGFLKNDLIIIVSNGFSLLLNCTILVLSLRYAKNKIGY